MVWMNNSIALSSPLIKLMLPLLFLLERVKTTICFNVALVFSSQHVIEYFLITIGTHPVPLGCQIKLLHTSRCALPQSCSHASPELPTSSGQSLRTCVQAYPSCSHTSIQFFPLLSDQFRPEQASAHHRLLFKWPAGAVRKLPSVCIRREEVLQQAHTRSHWMRPLWARFPLGMGESPCVGGWTPSALARQCLASLSSFHWMVTKGTLKERERNTRSQPAFETCSPLHFR